MVDYGPEKSWLNFWSDPDYTLDIVYIVNLPVGRQYVTIRDATKLL